MSDTAGDRAFAAAWKIVSAWDGKITKPVLRKAIDAAIDETLEEAAKLIEDNMLCGLGRIEMLLPRGNLGNNVGLAYAAAIRALKTGGANG